MNVAIFAVCGVAGVIFLAQGMSIVSAAGEEGTGARFKEGRPIHVLLKCGGSDHIYRLENDQKRWIRDIDTFLAEGHVWDDVRFVSCQYLRDLPTGFPCPR